jgi:hypothetical protein
MYEPGEHCVMRSKSCTVSASDLAHVWNLNIVGLIEVDSRMVDTRGWVGWGLGRCWPKIWHFS